MTTEVDQDVHRSIEPAMRLIISGLLVFASVVIAIFQLSGQPNVWIVPNKWLWVVVAVMGAIAVVVYTLPVRRIRNLESNTLSLRPKPQEPTSHSYSLKESIRFYDQVADVYDARLTREYLDTLRTTADLLLESFPDRSRQISVLDVGAGTGQFIRLLEGAKRVQWTCIEPANGMTSVLRRFFEGPPILPTIYEIGLEDIMKFVDGRRFEAITVNSMLSSLPELPDFSRLVELLTDDGILLISDGHPDIKVENQTFRIRALDGIHSLQIEHRAPSEITHAVTRTGQFVQVGHERNITKSGRLYSYVLCFRKVEQSPRGICLP